MSTTSTLLTVADFERLPNPPGGARQELRHGEVVEMPPPKFLHTRIQWQLANSLRTLAGPDWAVDKELPFRPAPEHEVWIADVAVLAMARWNAAATHTYLEGAPELVAEILSPANTVSEMHDRERTCMAGGCREFWLLDPITSSIRISTPDRLTRTYYKGELIQIPLLGGALNVDDILA